MLSSVIHSAANGAVAAMGGVGGRRGLQEGGPSEGKNSTQRKTALRKANPPKLSASLGQASNPILS